jgi:hypothetical protein
MRLMTTELLPSRELILLLAMLIPAMLIPAMEVIPANAAEKSIAEKILRNAWGGKPAEQKLADRLYQSDRFSDDTSYAYALVLIRQHRYAMARSVLDKLLERAPNNIAARETLIWINVAEKKYPDAVPELTRWVASFTKDDPERLIHIATAGRLLGFIDVSLSTPDAEFALLSASEKVRKSLPKADWDLFTSQRNRVHQRFSAMLDMRDARVAELNEEFKKEKGEQLNEIDESREAGRKRMSELEAQRKTLRSDLEQQLDEIDTADRPLRQRLNSLDATASSIARELSAIESQIFYLESRLYREDDPFVRNWIRNDLRQLTSLARGYDQDLFQLDTQASSVQSERGRIWSEGGQEVASLQGDLADAQTEGARVQQDIRRADNLERKLKKDKGPAAKESFRITLRARTLGTYYSYSADVKRAEFLETLR